MEITSGAAKLTAELVKGAIETARHWRCEGGYWTEVCDSYIEYMEVRRFSRPSLGFAWLEAYQERMPDSWAGYGRRIPSLPRSSCRDDKCMGQYYSKVPADLSKGAVAPSALV